MLHHPSSPSVYIGISSHGLSRPKYHGNDFNLRSHSGYPVVKWIKKLKAKNLSYEITVLDEFASATPLYDAERFHIAYAKSIGLKLLNCTEGGEGLSNPTDEVRKKLSENNLGKKRSAETKARMSVLAKNRTPEHKAKISASLSENTIPEVVRQKISKTLQGRTFSAEHLEKISTSLIGRTFSADHRAKLSRTHSNRSPEYRARIGAATKLFMTPEVRAKISRSNTGKKASLETRAKMSAAKKGKPLSPEHAAKIAAANRRQVHSPERRAAVAAMRREWLKKNKPRVSL